MSKGKSSCKHDSGKQQQDLQDARITESLGRIRHKILVMSGKGGVGKSSVAAYLSAGLAERGHKVGLMDVDLHGPSIPRILGLKGAVLPSSRENKILPISFQENLKVISIESLIGEDKDTAIIWRGPRKFSAIRQFISDIDWADLDFLIIDSPPGTGDEPLTVAQTIPDALALIVTTPQEISLADVRKSINFCRQVNMDILGVVENMSGLQCPHCNEIIDIFKTRGGEIVAEKEGLTFLGSLPLDPEVVRGGDDGNMANLKNEALPFSRKFHDIILKIESLTSAAPETAAAQDNASEPATDKETFMEKVIFAVPVAEGRLCNHFGHCDQFALITTQDGKIEGKSLQTPPPHEPGVLPKWLHEKGVNIVIAGGMGGRAIGLFGENNIKVVTGAPQDAPETLVAQYLSNSLVTGSNVCDH